MAGFWRTWMLLWSAGVALFGLVLSLGAIDATSGFVRWNFAALGQPHEGPFGPHLRFALAVMGPIAIGWALAIAGAIQVTPRLPAAPARMLWAFVTAGVLVWFLADSLLSIAVGFGRNVFPNLLLLGTYAAGILGSGVLKRA